MDAREATEVVLIEGIRHVALRMNDDDFEDELLPIGWERRRAVNGKIFYVDHTMKQTTWDKPMGRNDEDLPEGWEVRRDQRSSRLYYVDHNTRRTTWTHPLTGKATKKPDEAALQGVAAMDLWELRRKLSDQEDTIFDKKTLSSMETARGEFGDDSKDDEDYSSYDEGEDDEEKVGKMKGDRQIETDENDVDSDGWEKLDVPDY